MADQIGQLPSFSDLVSSDVDIKILITPSIVTLMTMVMKIVQNTIPHSQIVLELWNFAERYKNDSNVLGINFQDTLLKRLFGGKLTHVYKLRNRFFVATGDFDIVEYVVSI